MGRAFCETLMDYYDENPVKVNRVRKCTIKVKRMRRLERKLRKAKKAQKSDEFCRLQSLIQEQYALEARGFTIKKKRNLVQGTDLHKCTES